MPKNNVTNNIFLNQPLVQTATDYTALNTDVIIEVTNTAAIRTITLPAPSAAAATSNVGKFYVIKDTSGAAATNNIFVVPASGTIDGSGSLVIGTNYGAIQVYSDGTNYYSQAFVIPPATGNPLARANWRRFANTGFSPGATVIASNVSTWITAGPATSRVDVTGLTASFAPVNLTVAAQSVTIIRAGFYSIVVSIGWWTSSGNPFPVTQIVVNGTNVAVNQTYISAFNVASTTTYNSNFNTNDVIDVRLLTAGGGGTLIESINYSIQQFPTTF